MIYFFTLALDAIHFLPAQLAMMNRLSMPWKWIVVEGVAAPVKCTSWCNHIEPGLSIDGSNKWLQETSKYNPRVVHISKPLWQGKVEMCNAALDQCGTAGILMQIDADEIWTPAQIETIYIAFQKNATRNSARFWCRFFFGHNIVITPENTDHGHTGDWFRVWRFFPGMKFMTHEPPKLENFNENSFSAKETSALGLVFDHQAYLYESQVRFKEKYYGYENAVNQWRTFQANTVWPTPLKKWISWSHNNDMADRLYK